jgi:excisionase family DNA binding protein
MLKTNTDDASVDLLPEAPNLRRKGEPEQRHHGAELPMTVKDASIFLGVSVQTVYLWVERKQIPHLRVMGRNIRFLKSDLEPFRASFKQEVENG